MRLAALAAGLLAVASPASALELGKAPPAIDMPDLEGRDVDLTKLVGSVVVVDFWASWCDPCKEAIPVLDALQKRHAKDGLVVVGVNIDSSAKKMNRFLQSHPVSFRVVHDRKLAVAAKYEPPEMPSTFFVGRDGKLQHIHPGFENGDSEKIEAQLQALLKEAKPAP